MNSIKDQEIIKVAVTKISRQRSRTAMNQGSRDNQARSRDQGSRAAINSKDQENIKVGEIRRQQRQRQRQRQMDDQGPQ